ncbi:BCL2/adenovirus E1B 19 kDa protein-interacting protein 2 isoform X4 [Xenopus laevis]|uniref:BCL2/adenovirus E1B 19 kDa protein-interacting protein 2 isoform X4 n=2 Tax=Xenopus laevis TaxID=8355 RepID=A0A8J1MLQ4_XENLA|nr:BCL2/adenovirus E1B 19 kDa protein-interacting protein 2 isoform X4 [Xenopus laevis]
MIHGDGPAADMTTEDPQMKNADQDKFAESYERHESVATTEARLRMEGVELKEEWQDEDFPRPLPEDDQIEGDFLCGCDEDGRPAWAFPVLDQSIYCMPYSAFHNSLPSPVEMNSNKKSKKKLTAPNLSLNLDHSEGSILSDDLDESGELDLDDLDTTSENSNEFEWEDDLPKPKTTEVLPKGSIPEYTAAEEKEESRRWRMFRIGEQDHRVDMTAIEPYKKVISHGGYYGDGLNAIIVFAVCFMPDSSQPNYRYLMDNLFKYVIGTLEMLVAENYMIVYLNGATTRRKMPSLGWLRKCYQQIDRRLRKNLKSLIIVHPSWFIRTLIAITKPFISTKFSQKIKYVFSLVELAELIPMEYVSIPECIKEYDEGKCKKKNKRVDKELNKKTEDQASGQ